MFKNEYTYVKEEITNLETNFELNILKIQRMKTYGMQIKCS